MTIGSSTKKSGSDTLISTLSIASVVIISGLIVSLSYKSSFALPTLSALNSQYAKTVSNIQSAHNTDNNIDPELSERFQQAVGMLHAKQYKYAITALNRVLKLQPKMPEAYVNLGFALLGINNISDAKNSFEQALELRSTQLNAYWGLAIVSESLNDLESALGAMRTYIHLSTPADPYLPRARAALWEWEAQLGRLSNNKASASDNDKKQ